ncbi:hypothetical protein KA183_12880 [bacterium]|nr:hypothetical protein [bacterium]QQR57148.1 MAG: hypothetical protein IPG59_19510 [Candidatus Melainabacteria bacterium]
MAKLLSEDEEFISFLALNSTGHEIKNEQLWQGYALEICNGPISLKYGGAKDDGYLFCRQPKDEIKMFCQNLQTFLDNGMQSFQFEPSEPSLELSFERVESFGVKVSVFVDDGNASSAIARWDAFGLRFFTTNAKIEHFINELKSEFAC